MEKSLRRDEKKKKKPKVETTRKNTLFLHALPETDEHKQFINHGFPRTRKPFCRSNVRTYKVIITGCKWCFAVLQASRTRKREPVRNSAFDPTRFIM